MKIMKKTLMSTIGILMFSLPTYADPYSLGEQKDSVSFPIHTRTSYAEGCYVGNCTDGYGYYFYDDGSIAIGKWSQCGTKTCLDGVGLEDNFNYFTAATWSQWVPSFGIFLSHKNSLKTMGNYAKKSSDNRWYLHGLGLVVNGSSKYGSFNYGVFTGDSCQIYYSKSKRSSSAVYKDNTSLRATTCDEGNCVNGTGKMTYSSGFYIGDFRNGKWDGYGIAIANNGDKYAAKWVDGAFDQGYYYKASSGEEIAYMNISSNRWYRYTKGGELSVFVNNKYIGDYCSNQPQEGISPAVISYLLN
jgi:hypothetical protein